MILFHETTLSDDYVHRASMIEGVQHRKELSDFVHIWCICYIYDANIKYAVFFNKVEKPYII